MASKLAQTPDESALRTEIVQLGEMLGEVVAAVAGDENLHIVETVRRLSRDFRMGLADKNDNKRKVTKSLLPPGISIGKPLILEPRPNGTVDSKPMLVPTEYTLHPTANWIWSKLPSEKQSLMSKYRQNLSESTSCGKTWIPNWYKKPRIFCFHLSNQSDKNGFSPS